MVIALVRVSSECAKVGMQPTMLTYAGRERDNNADSLDKTNSHIM
jgi:hypothetical protein